MTPVGQVFRWITGCVAHRAICIGVAELVGDRHVPTGRFVALAFPSRRKEGDIDGWCESETFASSAAARAVLDGFLAAWVTPDVWPYAHQPAPLTEGVN